MGIDTAATVQLGRSPLRVPRLGLGTVPIGGALGEVSEEDARAVLRRSYDLGLRLIDTAPIYGYGEAERRIGRVVNELPREQLVLTTKVGRLIRRVSFPRRVGRAVRLAAGQGPKGVATLAYKATRVARRARGDHSIRLGYPFESGDRALGE